MIETLIDILGTLTLVIFSGAIVRGWFGWKGLFR